MKHSKGRFVAVLVLVLYCLCWLMTVFAYDDVPEGSWYDEAVSYVTEHGLFKGTEKNVFSPDEAMTRAMFVTVLCRADNANKGDFPDAKFTDVPADAYYATPVNWGKTSQLIEGTGGNLFSPDDEVSREQICTLIYRYVKYLNFTLPTAEKITAFTDADKISDWATEAVAACQAAGLVQGYETGDFQPAGSATRAEVATIFYRLGTMLETAGYKVGPGKEALDEEEPDTDSGKTTIDASDWRLMLVNPWNPLPDGYEDSLDLREIPGEGVKVDSRIYDDCIALMQGLEDAGIYAYIDSGYRSYNTQTYLYNRKISQYQNQGYSYSEAKRLAGQWVAVPGTSEHELGLALDISMYASNADTVHAWLAQHAWEYGFIYRYPEGKMDITGINPEPWHYRYVGKEYAKLIYESGLTLEEWLEQNAS